MGAHHLVHRHTRQCLQHYTKVTITTTEETPTFMWVLSHHACTVRHFFDVSRDFAGEEVFSKPLW